MTLGENYLEKLKKRATKGRVYREYQDTGLMLAGILRDEKHKALYIKLAKNRDKQELLSIAKRVAEREDVKNKGAYFTRILFDTFDGAQRRSASTPDKVEWINREAKNKTR